MEEAMDPLSIPHAQFLFLNGAHQQGFICTKDTVLRYHYVFGNNRILKSRSVYKYIFCLEAFSASLPKSVPVNCLAKHSRDHMHTL